MKTRSLAMYAVLFSCALAQAQPYPSKPITLIVPQPPGGAIDSIARGLGDELSKRLGVNVIVESKPGASGLIGTQAVAHASPDGYTLLVTNHTPVLAAPFVFSKVPYDVRKDLTLITKLAGAQFVLAVNSDVPARNMAEFVRWAKSQHSSSYGSTGVGTYSHLAGAFLAQSRGLDMAHVPYKGETPMVQELIAGRLAWGISTLAPLLPHIQSGRLRALAVFAEQRRKELPDVPTMAQAGFPDPEFKPIGWVGLIGPGGLPKQIVERLEGEARAVIDMPAGLVNCKRLSAVRNSPGGAVLKISASARRLRVQNWPTAPAEPCRAD